MLLVTYWAVVTLGSQYSIDLPGFLDDVWGSGATGVAGFALGLGVGLYVGRWWAVFAARSLRMRFSERSSSLGTLLSGTR